MKKHSISILSVDFTDSGVQLKNVLNEKAIKVVKKIIRDGGTVDFGMSAICDELKAKLQNEIK